MKRIVQPELLDELPHDDPRALHSRRDIARINHIVGNGRILVNLLRTGMGRKIPRRIVEFGAGDGTFMLELARQLSVTWKGIELVLVDRTNAFTPKTWWAFKALGWQVQYAVADVFDWLEKADVKADIMAANLFLHHFQEKDLARLLALAAGRCDAFAACEPGRGQLPLAFSRTLGLIGCNAVTRHDAGVSVQAGFAGNEISALWPENLLWNLQERPEGWFSHAFLARRKEGH